MTQTLPAPLDVKLMNLTASVLFVGCVLLVLAAGAWWVLRYPGFAIARIVVQGELVHNNAVTLRANVAPHLVGNFFTVDLRAAREAFEQVPWVRRAQVRRVYPGSLRVELQEHDAVAYWGPDTGSALVNSQGEVFEANVGDVEQDGLPRLLGPAGSSPEVLQMFGLLQPVFKPLGLEVETLELTGRGGWRATLDSDAVVELGGVKKTVSIMLVPDAALGEYVIVHVGHAIGILDPDEAQKTLAMFAEMQSQTAERPDMRPSAGSPQAGSAPLGGSEPHEMGSVGV